MQSTKAKSIQLFEHKLPGTNKPSDQFKKQTNLHTQYSTACQLASLLHEYPHRF